MAAEGSNERIGVFKTVLLIYTILGLHLGLIAGLVLLVIVFRGVFEYTLWILLGGVALIGFSAYRFWRRLKRQGRTLSETLSNPAFRDRPVEISFMGGIANVKLGAPGEDAGQGQALEQGDGAGPAPGIEDSRTLHRRQMDELSRLLDKGVITQEEFERAKQRLAGETPPEG